MKITYKPQTSRIPLYVKTSSEWVVCVVGGHVMYTRVRLLELTVCLVGCGVGSCNLHTVTYFDTTTTNVNLWCMSLCV